MTVNEPRAATSPGVNPRSMWLRPRWLPAMCVVLLAVPAEAGWRTELVDVEPYTGEYSSIVLDSSDQPHVAYRSTLEQALKHAWKTPGGTWQTEIVDVSPVGFGISLAIDANDGLHVAYHADGLWYAHFDGVDWSIETVDSSSDWTLGEFPSIAVDTDGRPHISYADVESEGDLRYATRDGATWHVTEVDFGFTGWSSIAVDGDGMPHIAYCNYSTYDFWYAVLGSDGFWDLELLESVSAGHWPQIAIDSDDNPHVACGKFYPDRRIVYLRWTGSDWEDVSIDAGSSDIGAYNALALDGDDRPHISTYDEGAADLVYLRHDGTVWHETRVATVGTVGKHSSLGLDSAGRPHVSYVDERSGSRLYYSWLAPPAIGVGDPVIEPVVSRLDPPMPNPFHTSTLFTGSVSPGPVSLAVFDVTGRRVRLVHSRSTGGALVVGWDGHDDAGRRLPAGTYVVTLSTATGVRSRKAVLAR